MKNIISKRMLKLPYSGVREIFDLANEMNDVIHFEIGEPDFSTPQYIVDEAFEQVRRGKTHYTSSAGYEPLRKKIAEMLNLRYGTDYITEEIVVTSGGMEALLLSMLATVDEGDEIIIPTPHWPNYTAHILLSEGNFKEYYLNIENGFKPVISEMDKLINKQTKGIILNYPHNPTGATLDRDSVQKLGEYAIGKDLLVYSDEAYESIIYENRKFESILEVADIKNRTIIIRTFSKSHAMTGWRIGYIAAPKYLTERIAKLHEHTTACASSISQMAAMAAMEESSGISKFMLEEYEARRNLLVRNLSEVDGLKVFKPEGAIYAFVDIHKYGKSSLSFAKELLEKERVAVVPGSAFGQAGEGFIRICFANSRAQINEGIDRIRNFVKNINV